MCTFVKPLPSTYNFAICYLELCAMISLSCSHWYVNFPGAIPAVFVMNHATPDDFQPLCLRQYHYLLMDLFTGTKTNIEGTVLSSGHF